MSVVPPRGRRALPAFVALGATLLVVLMAVLQVPHRDRVTATSGAASVVSGRGFRTPELLRLHYGKHGREFGRITMDEYLHQAQALRDAPVSATVLEIRRADSVVTRFDTATGSFIAFDRDGTIRTFFRPNDGERYFRRQAARRGD